MTLLVNVLVAGIAIGSIYALIAIGLVLIYKASGVINFAQGSMVMIGAFLTYAFVTQLQLSVIASISLALIFSAAIGLLIEFCTLRFLTGVSLISIIMVTLGISIIMDGSALAIWGSSNFTFPGIFPEFSVTIGGIRISSTYLWGFIFSMILLCVFILFFNFSSMGLSMRAAADNQKVSITLGISPRKVIAITWAISAIVATAGGILLASISSLHVSLSLIGLVVFPVVILGGLDSIAGAMIGGIAVGIIEQISGVYVAPLVGGAFQQVAAFIFLLIVLLVRPYGLFGTKEIERL